MSAQKVKQIHLPELLNELNFFEQIEVPVEVVDTLPDTGELGVLYYVSDEATYYYWAGSSFNEQPFNNIPMIYKYQTDNYLSEVDYNALNANYRDRYITMVEENVPTGETEWVIEGADGLLSFVQVDELLDAAIPENSVNTTTLYYVTSENKYYIWNGTEYIEQTLVDEVPYQRDKLETQKRYKVTNGVYEVILTPPSDGALGEYEYYSPNLIANDICYKIAIHSLPGNKVIFNDNAKNVIRIGASGIFNMDFGNNPIHSIRVQANNSYELYGTTIDLVYIGEDELGAEVAI